MNPAGLDSGRVDAEQRSKSAMLKTMQDRRRVATLGQPTIADEAIAEEEKRLRAACLASLLMVR